MQLFTEVFWGPVGSVFCHIEAINTNRLAHTNLVVNVTLAELVFICFGTGILVKV